MLHQYAPSRVSNPNLRAVRRHTVVITRCAFNFAESERVKQPQQGRRNRQTEKRQEQELRDVVHGLCAFSNKQLQAVSHLLSDDHIKQIKVAMDIPPTNQGRRRQEGLVMKLLRSELDRLDLDKLNAAVNMAQRSKLAYSDTDVEQQLQFWLEGLLENDQDVVDEVYTLAQSSKLDWQQLRTLVRQLQQAQQVQQHSKGSSPLNGAVSDEQVAVVAAAQQQQHTAVASADPEVQQLMQELAQQQQGRASDKKSKNAAATARRSIRNMLKPLAVAMHTAHC